MTKLPPLKAREVTKGLRALGFEKARQKGGHAIFHHGDCRKAAIPIHPAKDISPYLLSDVLKQVKISSKSVKPTFCELLGERNEAVERVLSVFAS